MMLFLLAAALLAPLMIEERVRFKVLEHDSELIVRTIEVPR